MRSTIVRCQELLIALAVALSAVGCSSSDGAASRMTTGTFQSDLAFLRQHTNVIVLRERSGFGQVVVAPAYQGRVMTSTTGGENAPSFGWLGRAAIAARKQQPHINVFGGEDRFWIGPEGGQYALYFKPGDPFDFDHWQVPAPLDWDKCGKYSASLTRGM